MFKNLPDAGEKGIFSVHKNVIKGSLLLTFYRINFNNIIVNRKVTDFLSYPLTSGIITYHSCQVTNKC